MEIDWYAIAFDILGTCLSECDIVDRYALGVDASEVAGKLADNGVTICAGCNWWAETGELDDDGMCAECQENEDE